MNALFPCRNRRRGFTLTELIVVIGVIAVLAGILLAAMGGVRRKALSTTTQSTMTEFSKACDAFQLEHGRYPGAIPENAMADVGAIPPISSTENALLDLMGGSRVVGPTTGIPADWNTDFACGNPGLICQTLNTSQGDWEIRADINRLGEGPLLSGTPYSPYFTPSESQVSAVRGQVTTGGAVVSCGQLDGSSFDPCLPDLKDAWGQPIIFLRRARPSGPLVGSDASVTPRPQFYLNGMKPYTRSPDLGELGRDQRTLSVLNSPSANENATLAQILRHPSLGSFGTADFAQAGTARGSYILISAGPDGIYFSKTDGPGTSEEPVDNIVDGDVEYRNPEIIKEYDDIRIFGGG